MNFSKHIWNWLYFVGETNVFDGFVFREIWDKIKNVSLVLFYWKVDAIIIWCTLLPDFYTTT